jgi:hypothetical protein
LPTARWKASSRLPSLPSVPLQHAETVGDVQLGDVAVPLGPQGDAHLEGLVEELLQLA